MSKYETVFIARQDLAPAQVEQLAEKMGKIITDNGGKVHKTEHWGLRTLAYRINKNRKGHYVLFELDTPAPALHELERQMRLSEDILRSMTIKIDEFSSERKDQPKTDKEAA